jgi:MSHA biogenesis protein MshL
MPVEAGPGAFRACAYGVAISAIVALSLALAGCESPGPKEAVIESSALFDIEPAKPAPLAAEDVPEAVSSALLAGPNSESAAQLQKPTRFTISVQDAPAEEFFLGLVADTDINLVAHPGIDGTLSLELKDVTIREILDVAKDVYGYEYKYESGIFTVYPRQLTTEIFSINYLDVRRVGVTDTRVTVGQSESIGNSNNEGNENDDTSNSPQSSRTGNGQPGVGTRVKTSSDTDFWPALEDSLRAIIGGETEGRRVITNPQSGLAVVKAFPRELNAVRDYLGQSELSVKRQVVLQTKILEVKLNESHAEGIDWSAINGQLLFEYTGGSPAGAVSRLTGSAVTTTVFSSVFEALDIDRLIRLLDTQGNVQVLSSPRISTVNNQKAVIRVGSDEFFVTGISNQTTTSAGATTSTPDIELESFFSGISLDITPQIAAGGDVVLHIHPMVSKVTDQQKELTVGSDTFSIPLALRDVRESDSIVRAKSGQVVVLGGLMQEGSADVVTQRGFLGDVPILNLLFRLEERVKTKTELVILMRPIVVEETAWTEEAKKDSDRLRDLSLQNRIR